MKNLFNIKKGAANLPRTEAENKRIREEQRGRILEAAKSVFARKGWSTTVADIAAEAIVSPGLIYHYFPNKEAIIREMTATVAQSDPNDFRRRWISGDTPSQKLEALISKMLKARREMIDHFGITAQLAKEGSPSGSKAEMMRRMVQNLQNAASDGKDLQEMMRNRYRKMHDMVAQLIAEGQKTGEFAPDPPDKLAFMVFSCIQSLTTLALNQPEDYRKHYPYTEIIMRMLKPNSPTPDAEGNNGEAEDSEKKLEPDVRGGRMVGSGEGER
ncbi:TetR/AcrR family transcriptional regulator [Cohnella caldifontis]|uniref:TetR/AcrR family transcriptional regulator n=1 Tax=Cohnella caldifontis TaxID=3027471 RepID=UPI0023EB222D|nr:TetR/AcrR family transcriptional regulator [Cohnella sp. YIM B05605]